MIRIALFVGLATVQAEFSAVPLEEESGFRCSPDGAISFESAKQIALEVHQGRVGGWFEGHRWFRQAGS